MSEGDPDGPRGGKSVLIRLIAAALVLLAVGSIVYGALWLRGNYGDTLLFTHFAFPLLAFVLASQV
jgi:hypothetical protein